MGLRDLVAVVLLALCWTIWSFYRRHTAQALTQQLDKAKGNKLKTIELLEERGFTVIGSDQNMEIISIIDDKSYTDTLTVDFVVQKGRQRYLVKTTSGGQSPRLGYKENREPLFTVAAVFSNPNILLVDPDRRNIRYMRTAPKKTVFSKVKSLGKSVLVFLLGAFCVIIIRYL